MVGAAVFTTGPVALQLGLLAAVLRRPDEAAAHLEDAARRCERLAPALFAARARAERARLLAARARPATGQDADNGTNGNVFRRDGDVWTVAFDGRTAALRDAKGLRDLAVLLAAPGREVVADRAGRRRRRQPDSHGSRRAGRRSGSGRPGPGCLPGPAG